MTRWVFNASPLILLGKIDQLHLIETLSPGFQIPTAVVDEIGAPTIDDPAMKWVAKPSIADHVVTAPAPSPLLEQWNLGRGETAVLSLALRDANPVVLDDLAARKFATAYQLPLIGTLGLLLRAKNAGLITRVAPCVRALNEMGANLSSAVIARALSLAGESG